VTSQTKLVFACVFVLIAVSATGCHRARRGPGISVPEGDSGTHGERDGRVPFEIDGGGRTCGSLGLDECSGECTDLAVDPANCGSCANRCGVEQSCIDGECSGSEPVDSGIIVRVDSGTSCSSLGLDDCSGICTDLDSDERNCGWCAHTCFSSETCVSGTCVGSDAGPRCPTGQTLCGSSCVDTRIDPFNCGVCGMTCASGSCSAGRCTTVTTAGESCSSPTSMPSSGGTSASFSLASAVANHTPFTCGGGVVSPDRAFSWTAPRSGTATFEAMGVSTDFDTVISVFSSSSCTSTGSLGCDDDGGTGFASLLSLSVTAGTTY